jgi:hypothetical protein
MPFIPAAFAAIGSAVGVTGAGAATAGALTVSTGLGLIGTGISAYSSIQQGKAQQRLNEYNAQVADQASADKARDGRILANVQREQNRRLQARQRALYAKAGVVDTTGSPLLMQIEQAGQLEMAALQTEATASTEAARLRQQAVLDRMAGKAARQAGNLNAGATILQGIGNAANNYVQYKAKT